MYFFILKLHRTELWHASDFWEYFEPIRKNMPANCSADVQAAILRVDQTFTGNNATAIQALKESFNMGDVSHLDDVAGARALTLQRQQKASLIQYSPEQFMGLAIITGYLWARRPIL